MFKVKYKMGFALGIIMLISSLINFYDFFSGKCVWQQRSLTYFCGNEVLVLSILVLFGSLWSFYCSLEKKEGSD